MHSPLGRTSAAFALGAAMVLCCMAVVDVAAQGITGVIRGNVTDQTTGRPVDGAQIYVAGTDLGTLTNADGQYQLTVRGGDADLRTRRVGYGSASRRVSVTPGEVAVADFTLNPAAIGLDVVVVTGAGAETEKRKLGNTVATIDASQLRNAPVVSLSEQLAARDPAVSVLPTGGLTGEGAQIRIRGSASLTQANEPVVYVDGVRVDRGGGFGDNVGAGGGGTPSRLDDINPEAIDHIEILKGAAAATLYGTEASSGVIQIFTKAGARGAPRWDFMTEQAASTYPATRYAPNAGWVASDSVAVWRSGVLGIHVPTAAELSTFYGRTLQPFDLIELPLASRPW